MHFNNVIQKFIYENKIIKRNHFQYQIVNVSDNYNDKKIVLITAYLNDGTIQKFWQDYNEALFTIDDIQALDWEILN